MHNMISHFKIITLCFVLMGLAVPSFAQDKASEPRHTKVELLADHSQVTAGQTFNLLYKIDIDPHWHIYWVNPGDSGEALRTEYQASDSLTIGEPQWPTPIKLPFGPLVNFGYEEQALIPVPVTVSNNATGDIIITSDVELLVCEEICIPEYETVSLTIPIGTRAIPSNETLFSKANEAQPKTLDMEASYTSKDGVFELILPKIEGFTPKHLFPREWGIIENTSDVTVRATAEYDVLTLNADTRDISSFDGLDFVVTDDNQRGYSVTAKPDSITLTGDAPQNTAKIETEALPVLLLFAAIGGLILNLMPCVFPILSLKALSVLKMNDKGDIKHARQSALSYTAGIIASFSVLAIILIVLKASGAQIGWGFQLQSPIVITFLAWLMILIGFNLLGFFELKTIGGSLAGKISNNNSNSGSFLTGVLAVLLATPCTAPFMATAIGASLTQGAFITWLIFSFLGLGLALPFLMISYIPAFAKALPKPGAWMVTFKQFLAFPMFGAFIWLLWVGAAQGGGMTLLSIMVGALIMAFVIWALPRVSSKMIKSVLWTVLALTLISPLLSATNTDNQSLKIEHQAYSEETLNNAIATGQPVLVNMTAKWCVTCLVNEKIALSVPQTQQIMNDLDVIYFKGDWTNRDDHITKYLSKYGRAGVPLYVVYKDGQETVLPQILTPEIVKNALTK